MINYRFIYPYNREIWRGKYKIILRIMPIARYCVERLQPKVEDQVAHFNFSGAFTVIEVEKIPSKLEVAPLYTKC